MFPSWSMFEMMALTTITCQTIPISLELHGFPHVPAEPWDAQFLQEWRRSCTLQMVEVVRSTAHIHWFLCPVINGASLGTQTEEKSSWQAEARRVVGLHFVIIVIWELKLRPLLAIEGCWYLVSAPRNLCMCHRLHFRLISDWTSPFRKQYRTATQNPWKDPRIKSNTRRT